MRLIGFMLSIPVRLLDVIFTLFAFLLIITLILFSVSIKFLESIANWLCGKGFHCTTSGEMTSDAAEELGDEIYDMVKMKLPKCGNTEDPNQ